MSKKAIRCIIAIRQIQISLMLMALYRDGYDAGQLKELTKQWNFVLKRGGRASWHLLHGHVVSTCHACGYVLIKGLTCDPEKTKDCEPGLPPPPPPPPE